MGISECAISPGSCRLVSRSTPPVARAASENVTATTATNTSKPAVRIRLAAGPVCAMLLTKLRQAGDAEKLSNAVDPSSTASMVTTPGRIGSDGRWSNGLPISIRPLPGLRRNGENRDATTLYTSNGSARPNHLSPQTIAPVNVTTMYTHSHSLIAPNEPGSGLASSSHTKANRPNAAGQYPRGRG